MSGSRRVVLAAFVLLASVVLSGATCRNTGGGDCKDGVECADGSCAEDLASCPPSAAVCDSVETARRDVCPVRSCEPNPDLCSGARNCDCPSTEAACRDKLPGDACGDGGRCGAVAACGLTGGAGACACQ